MEKIYDKMMIKLNEKCMIKYYKYFYQIEIRAKKS